MHKIIIFHLLFLSYKDKAAIWKNMITLSRYYLLLQLLSPLLNINQRKKKTNDKDNWKEHKIWKKRDLQSIGNIVTHIYI